MGETTGISWCDHTFNPWWGCVEVSEACDHCYARELAKRFGFGWGPNERRRFFGDKHWHEPFAWDRAAERDGVRRRVFCASMADVFEVLPVGHPDTYAMDCARGDLFALIQATPHLDWLVLTKRPGFAALYLHEKFGSTRIPNLWIGTTVENLRVAEARLWGLRQVKNAVIRFVSFEPLLEDVSSLDLTGIGWAIAGGESGAHARPSHPDWFRRLRDRCIATGIAFHFKQWGEFAPVDLCDQNEEITHRIGKKAAGHLLDGREWLEFPEVPAA
jgi:protein gp37